MAAHIAERANTLFSLRRGIEIFRLCVPGKNMLPSCDISGAVNGILTVSTEEAELIGVMLTCNESVTHARQGCKCSPDHIDASAVFEFEKNTGCENKPPDRG
jgi:hypothetical protein